MPVTEMKRSGIEVHGEYHYYQQSKIEQSDRPLVFYIFCGEQVVFLFGVNCQLSCDTSENEKEAENGENKSNVFFWE